MRNMKRNHYPYRPSQRKNPSVPVVWIHQLTVLLLVLSWQFKDGYNLLDTVQAFLVGPNSQVSNYYDDGKRLSDFGGGSRIHPADGLSRRLTSITTVLMSSSSSTSSDINAAPMTHKKKNLKTFQRFLEIECWRNSEFRELESVLKGVAESCKQINRIVQRAQTDDLYGAAVSATSGGDNDGVDGDVITNIQGEVQQQLDVLCNTYMLRAFCGSGSCIHSVASEEEDVPRCCSDVMTDSAFAVGDYIAVFDPIDGSKNIDASLPVGSIFGVYKKPPGATSVDDSTFLQDGRALVAAGYCLFSATTVLVLTLGNGVEGFTLDPDSGRFLHTLKDVRIPKRGHIYSFNEANWRGFQEPVQRYLHSLKQGISGGGLSGTPKTGVSDKGDDSNGKPMTARYIGALVADVHNILINGGIYGYPATRTNPNGKLRLLYECAPMAMILEQAGGAASTGGKGRILDIVPHEIHQRTPVFLGSVENVFELDQFFQYYSDDENETNGTGNEQVQVSEI